MFTVYEIECETPNHFYVGMSKNFEHRIEAHSNCDGARFTRRHGVKNWRALVMVETTTEAKRIETAWFRILKRRGYVVGGPQASDIRVGSRYVTPP